MSNTNRLIHETSPYLLQHARNPVDWYPWGEEAHRRAKEMDLPILLSIGYSACHWCHVMERESFENEEISRIMNQNFICIKVDREERPDLDDIYMAATQAINNGQGGWPMTVFLTPDHKPFFAGTYFPPIDRYGRPGFSTVLLRISELWRTNRQALLEQGNTLTTFLQQQTSLGRDDSIGRSEVEKAVVQLSREFDPDQGGFGSAPKFPPAVALSLLLRHDASSNDSGTLNMVRLTLDKMARGGMYDQVGGGFHRYSTDDRWLVPHFEKMLYDNALLTKTYLEAFQVTGDPFYRRIASEVLDYVIREMTSPEGGFYSATDADSEGREGKFFVWNPTEIQEILGDEEARFFCAYYDITESGNWEGVSIPNVPRPLKEVAGRFSIDPHSLQDRLDRSRARIYEARRKRVAPDLDDKILTSWNGLMIGAMAEGARVLGTHRYLEAAERAASFLRTTLTTQEGRLLRTYRANKAHLMAYLEDYAFLAEGLIDLYESGGTLSNLLEAGRLAERIIQDFSGENGGGFYNTSVHHEKLLVRQREGYDGAIPSANATAGSVLARLSFFFDRPDWRDRAMSVLQGHGKAIHRFPRAFCKSMQVLEFLKGKPIELVIVGTFGEERFESFRKEISRLYIPNKILTYFDPTQDSVEESSSIPMHRGKFLVDGKSAVFLCRDFVCDKPITDPDQIPEAIRLHREKLNSEPPKA